jgi:hypothetical protein
MSLFSDFHTGITLLSLVVLKADLTSCTTKQMPHIPECAARHTRSLDSTAILASEKRTQSGFLWTLDEGDLMLTVGAALAKKVRAAN